MHAVLSDVNSVGWECFRDGREYLSSGWKAGTDIVSLHLECLQGSPSRLGRHGLPDSNATWTKGFSEEMIAMSRRADFYTQVHFGNMRRHYELATTQRFSVAERRQVVRLSGAPRSQFVAAPDRDFQAPSVEPDLASSSPFFQSGRTRTHVFGVFVGLLLVAATTLGYLRHISL